eukprot:snap_masked-scaffold_10-processed-gene-12.26-mRNA-1 protein AED:1.00 eAED:1.00 QI:0/0/0/0/1/1/2/0/113
MEKEATLTIVYNLFKKNVFSKEFNKFLPFYMKNMSSNEEREESLRKSDKNFFKMSHLKMEKIIVSDIVLEILDPKNNHSLSQFSPACRHKSVLSCKNILLRSNQKTIKLEKKI